MIIGSIPATAESVQPAPAGILWRRAMGEHAMWWGCFAALLFGGGTLLFITFFILIEAYPALSGDIGLTRFLFIDPWSPLSEPPRFGILHAWLSSILITGIALYLAVPLGFGIGLFVSEIAPMVVRTLIQPCLDLLAGIPSVVYGFFGYVTLIPLFESRFDMATGESILAAGLILAAMALPFIASTSAEAFRAVAPDMKEAALAQGVTRWYVTRRIVLVDAAPGMFAAVALGLARAIGETLAVLMLAGNSTAVPGSVLDRGQPLTALIATELGEAGVGSDKYHSLFATSLVLIVVIVLINAAVWSLKKKLLRHDR